MRNKNMSLMEEAQLSLESLMEIYQVEAISEDGARIFVGAYVILYIKWWCEFFFIATLFIFVGVLLWKWTPESIEVSKALKVVLECGLYCTWSYVWDQSFDKHAVEVAKKFVALANHRPQYFTKRKEETSDGTEGNADKTE